MRDLILQLSKSSIYSTKPLYGGKPSLMWERIYQAGKDDEYKFQHYGINSIAEVVGWARPDDTPPRNGRTNKALRALGYPVRVNI
ncbi:hypothetical protein [Klebsiella pneumoniae]|uniref:hypothetical protein n=1 Tax=Klebsiella pneumoniae TaxID=573 RepID=UPI001D0B9B4A|nr:hypothetical protein [Klebsiella pneumoniae]